MKLKSYLTAVLFLAVCPITLFAKEKVAIIGAGPAGLMAAQHLLKRGYDVKVFEKEQEVGGKCKTIPESSGHGIVELGAIIISPYYDNVLKVTNEVKEKLRDHFPLYSLSYAQGEDPSYKLQSDVVLPHKDDEEIKREVKIFEQAYLRIKYYLKNDLKGIPPESELNKSFEDWADDLGLKHFKEIYRFWITSFGYGELKDVPAYYPLYLLAPPKMLEMATRKNQNMRMLAHGYGGLMKKMVEHYRIPVITGAMIKTVKRDNSKVTVSYTVNDNEDKNTVKEEFDRLVVACGFDCIDEFLEKKTTDEEDILKGIHYNPYDIVIARIPQVPKGASIIRQNLNRPGHVALMSKNSAGRGEDIILYIPRMGVIKRGSPFNRPTRKELENRVREDMSEIGYKNVQIIAVQSWDKYFPHFLDPNYFNILESIQGKNRTIYVGSLARYEIVEKAMADAVDTVERYIFKTPNYTPYHVTGLNWYLQLFQWQMLALGRNME